MNARRSEVAQKMNLAEIRYSMVWEDHALLDAALAIGPDDDVLSIASAGNNVLSLLLREPRSVTAIDMSPAQCALFELKLAGIRALDVVAFRALLGFGADLDPLEVYDELRTSLPDRVATFWDDRRGIIAAGIHRCGRLERYFGLFQREHLQEVWAPDLVERLFDAPSLAEQVALFEAEAFTADFQARFRDYFGRESMARRGRDPAQFAYVDDGDVGGYFLRRFHTVCTTLPLAGNFYVERFLTGTHRDLEHGPEYLRTAEFERLKSLIDRVHVVEAELETHLDAVEPGTYSRTQLSDVFEYMSAPDADALFAQLARALRSGGRIAYWNLLVPRAPSDALHDVLRPLTDEAEQLWRSDRSWFYRAFRLDEVVS